MLLSIILIPVCLIAGAAAHELTHIITIYPVADNIRIKDHGFTVEYDYRDRYETYTVLSQLSPSVIGLSALCVIILSDSLSFPALSTETVGIYAGSLIYCVGGPEDYQDLI